MTRSTRSQTAVSTIGSASIAKPGLTPVASTATFAFFAQRMNLPRLPGCACSRDNDSSSVVETIGVFALRIVSICGSTLLIDELVHMHDDVGPGGLQRLGGVCLRP